MKNILYMLIFLFCQTISSQNGLRFSSTEFFTASISVDPSSSIKEKGLDVLSEIEYSGLIYAKVGFESFSVLYGGYRDYHFGLGVNLTSGYFEKTRYYLGVRTAIVFRDTGYAINYGLESGIDYNLTKNIFIGIRGTLDKRYEQQVIFGWKPELKGSGFVRIGYKWYYKRH